MPLPQLRDIQNFLQEKGPSSKRDLAKYFRIKGYVARVAFKELISKAMIDGRLHPHPGKRIGIKPHTELTKTKEVDRLVLRVTSKTSDGELLCTPTNENLNDDFPQIILESRSKAKLGDTISAILKPVDEDTYLATFTKPQASETPRNIIGTLEVRPHKEIVFKPLVKSLAHMKFTVIEKITNKDVSDGMVVLAEVQHAIGGTPQAKIIDVLHQNIAGNEVSLGIAAHNLPHEFPEYVMTEANSLYPLTDINGREDLRDIPLVTIDGADAKDFDDAVWAEPWETSKIKNGFHIIVAIADVAHYVEERESLDKEAFVRGNSVYFPGYVVPMLPEALSNNLCSLVPKQDRPTMACHMYIDSKGKLHNYTFTRAVIHSHARLTYEHVQQALDGHVDETVSPVMESTIVPLHAAFQALLKNRNTRGALDLDMPETVIDMAPDGKITALVKRERVDAHRLIEEMMVLANVAAASELQKRGADCLYRIHPEPSEGKRDALIFAFKDLGIKMSKAATTSPQGIQKHIEMVPEAQRESLYQSVLRAQEQARYAPENIGHFGLALQRYAHFTSPIRRYSDLIVHRSLIKTLKLVGHEKIKLEENLEHIAEHLCITERRAQKAEWDVRDRLIARYYSEFTGNTFKAKITGIHEFGAFVSIDDGQAEGLLHVRDMHDDHYAMDNKRGILKGRRTNNILKMGGAVDVILQASSAETGKLTFETIGKRPERRPKPNTKKLRPVDQKKVHKNPKKRHFNQKTIDK